MSAKRFVVTFASLFLIASTVFAPLPRGIALNYETKQCAGYWGGDEYVTYELPSGWKYFEFQYSEDSVSVNTDIGSCKAHKIQTTYATQAKDCCSQLGYTFVSENIGIRKITSFNLTSQAEAEKFNNQKEPTLPIGYYILFSAIFILLFVLIALFIRQNKKE